MTTLRYRFKINGIEVEEPVNWDSTEITVSRSENYHGLENIFSSKLSFWNSGAQLLRSIYDQYGVDGEALLLIEYYCQDAYTTLFNGFLNLSTYSYVEGEVSCNFEDNSISRLLKNRLDTPISLDNTKGLDGQDLSVLTKKQIGLHSKRIIKKSQWIKPDNSINPFNYPIFNWNTFNYFGIILPFQNILSEINDSITPDSFTLFQIDSPSALYSNPVIIIKEDGNYNLKIKIEGIIYYEFASISFPISGKWEFAVTYIIYNSDNSQLLITDLQRIIVDPLSSDSTYYFNISIDDEVNYSLLSGMKVVIYASVGIPFVSTSIAVNATSYFTELDFNVTADTIAKPSTADAFLIYEALNRVSESITGQNDILRSDLYGRSDSSPRGYLTDGIESWGAITNGLNIRNMKDSNGDKLPIVCKFSDIFNSLDAMHNIGMQIANEYDGIKLRVEGKAYFYNKNITIFSALNVDGLQRSVANDLYFSNISFGSEKWNLNQGQSNGRDEFNAVNNWYSPLKTIKNSFQKLSKYITSGYILEYTRRVQYSANPTTEYETDNDNFIIAVNRQDVTSNKYSQDGSSQTYGRGTVSERDENFTTVENVISPETCYNLRYSPLRRFAYWFKFVCAGIWKTPTIDITFQSGEANYLLKTKMNSVVIDSTSGLHQENESFNNSVPNQLPLPPYNFAQSDSLFIPEYIDFKYPVSFSDFISILANTKGVVEYSCNDSGIEKGFIKELKFTPNSEGGECNFKLIRAFE